MATQVINLPPGFVLDAPDQSKLPAGFVMDAKQSEPNRTIGEQAIRAVERGARGFSDSALETIGGVPDLVTRGMRAVGLNTPEPGFYTDKLKQGFRSLGGVVSSPFNAAIEASGMNLGDLSKSENILEKAVYGAGSGVADAAAFLVPAAAASRAASAGSMPQRIAQALSAQPSTQLVAGGVGGAVSEATDNPLYGVAASLAVPSGASLARGIVSPVTNRLTPEQQRLAQVLQNEGVQLRPGQETGSRALQTTESVLDNMPLSGGMGQTINRTQQDAFNTAALRRAGINASSATPAVLDRAARRIGNEFTRISNATTVNLDNQFLDDIQQAQSQYARKLPSQTREVFQNYLDDILNSGNVMSGPVYQTARSDLGKQVKTMAATDPTLSQALRGIRTALDEAANRSVPAALRDDWADARRQYANLKAIMGSVATSGAQSASGDISGGQLWNAVKAGMTKDSFVRGRGELNDLARAGQVFIKPQIQNSGTTQRTTIANLLQGGAAGGSLLTGNLPALAASVVGPPLAQAFINSAPGRAYLTNQLATGIGPRNTPELYAALLAAQALKQKRDNNQ